MVGASVGAGRTVGWCARVADGDAHIIASRKPAAISSAKREEIDPRRTWGKAELRAIALKCH